VEFVCGDDAVGASAAEDVADDLSSVDADECGFVLFDDASALVEVADAAEAEGEVWLCVDLALEGEHGEGSFGGVDLDAAEGFDAVDEACGGESVFDELVDGAEFELVFVGELFKVGEPGHFAVVAHDFDDDGGGVEVGEAAEVDAAFGLSCADEYAAVA